MPEARSSSDRGPPGPLIGVTNDEEAGLEARGPLEPSSLDVDDVLLVLVGILLEVADGLRVGRLLLRERLEYVELLVLGLADIDVEDGVMRLRVDGRLAGRAVERRVLLERLDHLHAVDTARLP